MRVRNNEGMLACCPHCGRIYGKTIMEATEIKCPKCGNKFNVLASDGILAIYVDKQGLRQRTLYFLKNLIRCGVG